MSTPKAEVTAMLETLPDDSNRVEPERIPVAAVIQGSRLLQSFVQRIENESKSNL